MAAATDDICESIAIDIAQHTRVERLAGPFTCRATELGQPQPRSAVCVAQTVRCIGAFAAPKPMISASPSPSISANMRGELVWLEPSTGCNAVTSNPRAQASSNAAPVERETYTALLHRNRLGHPGHLRPRQPCSGGNRSWLVQPPSLVPKLATHRTGGSKAMPVDSET